MTTDSLILKPLVDRLEARLRYLLVEKGEGEVTMRTLAEDILYIMGESAQSETAAAYNGQTKSDGSRSLPSPSPASTKGDDV